MVILEALASGLQVAATRSGGQVDIIDSDAGLLVNECTPEALALAADTLAARRGPNSGAVARARAQQFAWEPHLGRREKFLEEAVS